MAFFLVHFSSLVFFFSCFTSSVLVTTAFVTSTFSTNKRGTTLFSSPDIYTPTELPDSLEDGAQIAAEACAKYWESNGEVAARCRVDFDTSVGDETFTLLKSSTEFMQQMVTFLCNGLIPGLQERRMEEMMRVSQARSALRDLDTETKEEGDEESEEIKAKREECMTIIRNDGRVENDDDASNKKDAPVARVYFPDEGNAALARRDWAGMVPDCVQFSACGGVTGSKINVENDVLVFFFCPKASESDSVEELLLETETKSKNLKLSVFVNPNLVDMGVTGFGMAGRMLRERLIDPLPYTYYLRTLPWGALTRTWPQAFSVWQEDENSEGGYRLIKTLSRLPSNPEVEDIYDIENGLADAKAQGGGLLDQLGDFVNGMTKL